MWVLSAISAIVFLLIAGSAAAAEPVGDLGIASPPSFDCANLLEQNTSGYYDWRDTLMLEHCDRIKRLWRIADAAYGPYGRSPPRFFDGAIEAANLPHFIGVRMPLLRVVFPERVFFDTDATFLRPEAMEVVRIIAENLRSEPPDVALFVAGHADVRGSREYNQALSVDRANAIAEAIKRQGVNHATVWRVGFGEDQPLLAGDTDVAYGENRRVEFLFSGRPEAVAAWLAVKQINLLCKGRTTEETQTCKAKIQLSDSYEVAEVSGGEGVADIEEHGKTSIASSAPSKSAAASSKKMKINMSRGKRFNIDVRNGRVEQVGKS